MSRTYNELSAVSVVARAFDNDGINVLPTTARYRVDDCRTGKQLVNWTVLAPSLAMTISIPGSVNKIISTDRSTPEVKTVTISTDEGLTTQHYVEYTYRVKDLSFAQAT